MCVEVTESRRRMNARIHSAGHLLDSAFENLGVTDLIPSKVETKNTLVLHPEIE